MCESFNFVLFQSDFCLFRSLAFHMNFRISLSISVKQAAGIFYSDCVESVRKFEECCYFNSIKFFSSRNIECLSIVMVFSFLQ